MYTSTHATIKETIINNKDTPKSAPPLMEEESETVPAAEPVVDYRDDLLRLNAEYVNYRTRVERDKDVARIQTVNAVLKSLLPVLDDLENARKHGDLEDGPFSSIARKMESVLESHGLIVIDEPLVEFDPEIHMAVISQPIEGLEENIVAEVLRTGYKVNDMLIRPAQVMVAQ